MDPAALASVAISLLAPYLSRVSEHLSERVADSLGSAADRGFVRLYDRIKAKVSDDRVAEPMFERFEQQPNNSTRSASFVEVLGELLEADPQFASDVSALVNELRPAAGQTYVSDAGVVTVHGDVHISGKNVAGRDMTINREGP